MTKTRSLLADDDLLGDIIAWHAAGQKTVLVTLVSIDGTIPRPLGAQMAVAESGAHAGYLSGGCIEKSVTQEALSVLKQGRNRLVRYGKDSAYFDLKLPCGSGLDLYFDRGLDVGVLAAAEAQRHARAPFVMSTDLRNGVTTINTASRATGCRRDGEIFHRLHVPLPRVVLVGGGPALPTIARLIAASGLEIDIVTPDDDVRSSLAESGLSARSLNAPEQLGFASLDRWTAAVVAFHEHDWEAPVLAELLKSESFYIGVMGSKKAHQDRIDRLLDLHVSQTDIQRMRSPIGLIAGAKSRTTLGVGILAEVIAEAKSAGLLA